MKRDEIVAQNSEKCLNRLMEIMWYRGPLPEEGEALEIISEFIESALDSYDCNDYEFAKLNALVKRLNENLAGLSVKYMKLEQRVNALDVRG